MQYLDLIKKTRAFVIIKNDLLSGRLSHAYMAECFDSRFLSCFMRAVAQTVVCTGEDKPCGECDNCKRAESKTYPDIYFFGDGGGKLLVEDINAITGDVYQRPIENDDKFYFLINFDSATEQAQNKLLKTLEEPPTKVHIFLGCSSSQAVLGTITSRVKILPITGFSEQDIYEYLAGKTADKQLAKTVSVCCNGQVGVADEMLENKGYIDMLNLAFDCLYGLKSTKNILEYSQRIIELKSSVAEFLSIMQAVARDVVATKLNPDTVFFKHKEIELTEIARINSVAPLLYFIDEAEQVKTKIKRNCNLTMLIDMLLYNFLEVRYKCQQ